jgi:CheY-like chemotaxis protein
MTRIEDLSTTRLGRASRFPDLVIVEMKLSPLDGLEVAEALKLIMPNLSVFLLTRPEPRRESEIGEWSVIGL